MTINLDAQYFSLNPIKKLLTPHAYAHIPPSDTRGEKQQRLGVMSTDKSSAGESFLASGPKTTGRLHN